MHNQKGVAIRGSAATPCLKEQEPITYVFSVISQRSGLVNTLVTIPVP